MTPILKVLLIGERDQGLNDFRALLGDAPALGFMEVQHALYMNPPPGLDALLLTLPAAERWSPDFKSRKAQVLKTSERDQSQGFPPFIVTGVSLGPEDPSDLISQLRILIERAFEAVKEHNLSGKRAIASLGIWVMDLTRCARVDEVSNLLKVIMKLQAESD